MRKSKSLWSAGFQSSSGRTPEFTVFAETFKKDLERTLSKLKCKVTMYSVGHFYVSGFFRTQYDECFYFSISDVRFFRDEFRLLFRRANDEKDFTGAVNKYVTIKPGMDKVMAKSVEPLFKLIE